MIGWIKLHRKILEWEWYDDINVFRLFTHLLLTVNYEDKKWHGISIKRGQILIGVEELGKKSGLTRQQTRTAIDKLISTNEITKSTTSLYTILTINKFEEYQDNNQVDNQRATNEQPSNNQVVTTTKEYKEVKEEKKLVYTPPNLSDEDFSYIANKYNVPLDFVKFQYDKMVTWAESKPNNPKLKGRNWKMTLMTFVRDDALKIKQDHGKQASEVSI